MWRIRKVKIPCRLHQGSGELVVRQLRNYRAVGSWKLEGLTDLDTYYTYAGGCGYQVPCLASQPSLPRHRSLSAWVVLALGRQ